MGDLREAAPGQQPRTGPSPGTLVIVDVTANDDGNGNVSWSHSWRFDGSSGGGNGEIDIPSKDVGQPGTPIHFHLRDNTKVGLSFAADPIWVARAPSPCPCNAPSSDAEITDIDGNRHLLKVLDRNEEECTLHYNLRFDPDPGRYYYDPAIKNGGTQFA